MATARETIAQTDEPPIVFVSYSHKDEAWKDKLRPHLQALEVKGRLTLWDDRKIDAGDEWYDELRENMEKAGIAVCLISPDFLASDFCMKQEVAHFVSQRKEHGMTIIPILVQPCFWECEDWLSDTQMIPHDGKSLALDFPKKAAQNQQLAIVAKTIFGILDDPNYQPPPPPAPTFPPLLEACIDIERLPVTGKELFGRQAELQMLDEAWASDGTNIVALTAWGGVGKSTLVNKWTERLAKDNYRGAERVFAWSFYSQGMRDQATSADAFIDEALRFFEDEDPSKGSPWAKGERLAELVSRKRTLLLLDGMEPLQDAYQGIKDPALARLVECLAVENAGLAVITTREKVKELDDFPDQVIEQDLEQISPEAGRALLRVKRVRGSDGALEQASRDFGNHALAINLLASYLQFYDSRHISQAVTIPDLTDLEEPHHRHPRRVMAAFADRFGDSPALDVLHMIGLFDRPADAGCIAALRGEPAIPGLTDKLFELDEIGWQNLLDELRTIGLLAPRNIHQKDELDAHPLVREHFGARLRAEREEAWKAGHEQLYEHLKASQTIHRPDSLAEMAPLFQAVHHGCQAGQWQGVFDEVYDDRIIGKGEYVLQRNLGAFGADLGLLASFFDLPFERSITDLTERNRVLVIANAAFDLRALGRLGEAVAPMRAGLKMAVEQEDWGQAARCASNLSELQLTLGEVEAAAAAGEAAVEHADRSDDAFERRARRVKIADVRHQAGGVAAAKALFEEAEGMQAESQPAHPLLYSFRGYVYCDLLLTLGQADAVRERAAQTTKWLTNAGAATLLDIALDRISLGRAALALGGWDEARIQLDQAVDGLRESGAIHHIPRGLLARGAFFRDVQEFNKSRKDLDETMRIATRSGMRLHECDAHLEYARLILAEGGSQTDARASLDKAEVLVRETGYHRRDGEVADLKEKLGV